MTSTDSEKDFQWTEKYCTRNILYSPETFYVNHKDFQEGQGFVGSFVLHKLFLLSFMFLLILLVVTRLEKCFRGLLFIRPLCVFLLLQIVTLLYCFQVLQHKKTKMYTFTST